ncbi:unnamed protein product [Pylaiella littoralis]
MRTTTMMTTKLAWLSVATGVLAVIATGHAEIYYSSVTAGQGFSCGVLEATGRVECWGEGALGDAPSLDFLEGQLVDKYHKSISGGGFHVCGLYYEDGKERSNKNVIPYCVASFEAGAEQDMGQLAIPDLEEGRYWREMSAGGQHTCGIDTDRKVYCWGSEDGSRRALGEFADMEHRHISAGGLATCGVLMSDRTGYCVGVVPQGALPEEFADTKFARLEAGGAFSYGLVKDTKELIKWGPAEGDSVAIVESIPLTPPSGFRSTKTFTVAAGAAHVCATGRRNRREIADGLPSKGVWCAGTGGEEISGISDDA